MSKLTSILNVPMKCPKCNCVWAVGECEPDIDGEGSLGCPECMSIVEQADCECQGWARAEQILLTNHHKSCLLYDAEREAYGIIDALINGVQILVWPALPTQKEGL